MKGRKSYSLKKDLRPFISGSSICAFYPYIHIYTTYNLYRYKFEYMVKLIQEIQDNY